MSDEITPKLPTFLVKEKLHQVRIVMHFPAAAIVQFSFLSKIAFRAQRIIANDDSCHVK